MSNSLDVDISSDLLGNAQPLALSENYMVHTVYNVWFGCYNCGKVTDEYCQCRDQYKVSQVAKCAHCGALNRLTGKIRSKRT